MKNDWNSQLKGLNGIDFSRIAGLNASTIGLIGATKQAQNNWNSQLKGLKGLDFSRIAGLNTSAIGLIGATKQFKDNWSSQLKGVDFSKIAGLNTSTIGLIESMKQSQNNWSSQLKGIDFNKIAGLNTSTIGLIREIKQAQNNWNSQLKDIDFSKIKINENGTIDYLNETINIKDAVEDVSSYFLEDRSTEQEVERNTEYFGKLNSIINIIVYVFLFALIMSTQAKLYTSSSVAIEQQITENIEDLNKNIERELDELAKLFLFILTLYNKALTSMDNFDLKNPAQFAIIYTFMPEIIKYIRKRIYGLVKKQKESIIYSDEILNDRKATLNFIKKRINSSIKSEYDNKIINRIFYSNFGLVNHKSLDVRSCNNLKAPVIYKLSLGEIVTILDKNRKWTSIEFIGKGNCNYLGWVLTRYIDKFE